MSAFKKPEHLTEDYQFKGPERMYITGPLAEARLATRVDKAIRYVSGTMSGWWPTLDSSMFFLGGTVPQPNKQETRRLINEDSKRLLFDMSQFKEILFVNESRRIDSSTAYKIGHAVGLAEIERVYYLGHPTGMGSLDVLTENGDITFIQDPMNVFRWETDEGHALVASSEMLIDPKRAREAIIG